MKSRADSAALIPRINWRDAARLMLARELWARHNNEGDYSLWDEDSLGMSVYENWLDRADETIRGALARGY